MVNRKERRPLRERLPRWASPEHPIYQMERRYQQSGRILQSLESGCLPVVLVMLSIGIVIALGVYIVDDYSTHFEMYLAEFGVYLIILYLFSTLVDGIVSLLTVARISSVVSREVELQSWSLLRATSLSLREILFAKVAGAMESMKRSLWAVLVIRGVGLIMLIGLGITFLYEEILWYASRSEIREFFQSGTLFPIILILLLVLIFYILHPFSQFLLNASVGLFASARSKSRSRALTAAILIRLALGYFLSQGGGGTYFFSFAFLGFSPVNMFESSFIDLALPVWTPAQVVWIIAGACFFILIAYYGLQVGISYFLMGAAQKRARAIGG